MNSFYIASVKFVQNGVDIYDGIVLKGNPKNIGLIPDWIYYKGEIHGKVREAFLKLFSESYLEKVGFEFCIIESRMVEI